MVLDPEFLLLDEPFTGIDPLSVRDLQAIIRALRGQGDRRPADGPCRPGGPRDHGPGLHPRGRPHPQGGDARRRSFPRTR
ncbi:MAG: hypothetical protein MZW92_61250 [Comamonadaceae bacterium]|nr:hypothetical protein [Comamonadaceae bacterium]